MGVSDVHQMMAEIAKLGGSIEYYERQPPFPQELIDAADELGWLTCRLTGGAAGAFEEVALTDEGRSLAGMRPRFSIYRLISQAVYQLRPANDRQSGQYFGH